MNVAALVGWAFVTILLTIMAGPAVLVYAIIYGLLISFLCCWVIGAPILKWLMRREITLVRAAFWGAAIAFLFSSLNIALERYQGWQTSLDPSRSGNWSGGTIFGQFEVIEVAGTLTAYGWLMVALSTLSFSLVGAFVAVVVWFLVGDPAVHSDDS